VSLAIGGVGEVRKVAAVLGISEPTVKMHSRRVFSKTGTARQSDLTKLVGEFTNPLA
jgi:DNA-binding CsgD family transcriptional regulator